MAKGLSYGQQSIKAVIGTIASPSTLTNAYAGNTNNFPIGGVSMLTLVGTYTTGATETSNNIDIKVEGSADKTNYYQEMTESAAAGVVTMYPATYKVNGAGSATAYPFRIMVPVADKRIKISIKETGVAANYGTVVMQALMSGEY